MFQWSCSRSLRSCNRFPRCSCKIMLISKASSDIQTYYSAAFLSLYSLRSICKNCSLSDDLAHHAVPWDPVGPWFSLARPGPWLLSRLEEAFIAWSGMCPFSIPSSCKKAGGNNINRQANTELMIVISFIKMWHEFWSPSSLPSPSSKKNK